MFVAIVNSKGGVGKSTIAVHAAAWLHERGLRVVLLDADAQHSSSEWLSRAAPDIRVVRESGARAILDCAPRLQAVCDVVVADGPAALGPATVALIAVADRVLMPIGPSMMDVNASYRTARMIYRARFKTGGAGRPEALTIMNRVQSRTRLARTTAAAILNFGFPAAPVALQLRQAYAEACGLGDVVWRMGAAARPAANEIHELFENVLSLDRATGVTAAAQQAADHPADRPAAAAGERPVDRTAKAVVLKERVLPARELIAAFDRHPADDAALADEAAFVDKL